MNAPKRIEWLDGKAMIVERVHQAEYATIVTVGTREATPAEVDAWRFGTDTQEGPSE